MEILRINDKLNKLREAQNWHSDTLKEFDNWEKQISELESKEEFFGFEPVVKLAEALAIRLKNIRESLLDRKLSETDRIYLFALKDIIEVELPIFSRKDVDTAIADVENKIDLATKELSQSKSDMIK